MSDHRYTMSYMRICYDHWPAYNVDRVMLPWDGLLAASPTAYDHLRNLIKIGSITRVVEYGRHPNGLGAAFFSRQRFNQHNSYLVITDPIAFDLFNTLRKDPINLMPTHHHWWSLVKERNRQHHYATPFETFPAWRLREFSECIQNVTLVFNELQPEPGDCWLIHDNADLVIPKLPANCQALTNTIYKPEHPTLAFHRHIKTYPKRSYQWWSTKPSPKVTRG